MTDAVNAIQSWAQDAASVVAMQQQLPALQQIDGTSTVPLTLNELAPFSDWIRATLATPLQQFLSTHPNALAEAISTQLSNTTGVNVQSTTTTDGLTEWTCQLNPQTQVLSTVDIAAWVANVNVNLGLDQQGLLYETDQSLPIDLTSALDWTIKIQVQWSEQSQQVSAVSLDLGNGFGVTVTSASGALGNVTGRFGILDGVQAAFQGAAANGGAAAPFHLTLTGLVGSGNATGSLGLAELQSLATPATLSNLQGALGLQASLTVDDPLGIKIDATAAQSVQGNVSLALDSGTVVGKKAAQRLVGEYQVEQWPGNAKPTSVRVSAVDGELRFAYTMADKTTDARFVLSKIPNSERGLYVLSVPGQDDTNQANLFFITKRDEDPTHVWAVFSTLPVAKEHLSYDQGTAKAEDVKQFLAKHADAFVEANKPQIVLQNPAG